MRTLFGLILLASLQLPAMAKDPGLTPDQVSAIGRLILGSKSHEEYQNQFSPEKLRYDPKDGVWKFEWTPDGALFPCMPIPFFEIRDSDAHLRIGTLASAGYRPASSEKFRMPPLLQRKINRILDR